MTFILITLHNVHYRRLRCFLSYRSCAAVSSHSAIFASCVRLALRLWWPRGRFFFLVVGFLARGVLLVGRSVCLEL